jgi:hypothetical protein
MFRETKNSDNIYKEDWLENSNLIPINIILQFQAMNM